jgi:hypothetical protein
MRRTSPVLSLVALVALVAMSPTAAGAQNGGAMVTVLHGLPQFTADVYVNGELTLNGFEPATSTEPLALPAGTYVIEIREVGAPADSTPALADELPIEDGQNLSIIANLTTGGDRVLTVFSNDVSRVRPGTARLVVRHVAEAPSLDVSIDGENVATGLEVQQESVTELRAGTYSLDLSVSGSDERALGPVSVDLEEGTSQIVYAMGSTEADTMDLMVQTIRGLQSGPSRIDTGIGDGAAPQGVPTWGVAVMVVAAVSALGSAVGLIRNRWRPRDLPSA